MKKFEKEYLREENLSIKDKYKLLEAMYQFAKKMKALDKNFLQGIEKDIKYAKAINSV